MTPSQELLTRVKAQHDLTTDWQLHKVMGCTINGVRRALRGEGELSTDLVLVACELLNEDPQPWIIRVELRRCQSPKRREILKRILARLEESSDRAMAVFLAVAMVPFFQ